MQTRNTRTSSQPNPLFFWGEKMLELLLIVALLLLAVLCLMAGIVALFRLRILLGLLLLGGFVVLVVLAFCMGFLTILWKCLQEHHAPHFIVKNTFTNVKETNQLYINQKLRLNSNCCAFVKVLVSFNIFL